MQTVLKLGFSAFISDSFVPSEPLVQVKNVFLLLFLCRVNVYETSGK